ncbi:MAG TPA: cytochrome c oxidase subunit II [Gaiellaceae bacterium]
MRKRSIIQMVLVGVAVGGALALVAILIPWLPPADSTQAHKVDDVYWFVTIICMAIFALVAGVSVYSVWKFRAGPEDLDDGSPIHGHTGLEVVWTAIPAALVTAISIYSGVVLTKMEEIPKDHRIVQVSGQQFTWSFQYPEAKVTSGQLTLPVNQPVELKLSARDVIHSFWVPEWRVKKDAVPGIETNVIVTPTKVGTFTVICTELCGLGHAAMRAKAVVMTQQGFDAWLRLQKRLATLGGSAQGKTLFTQQCGTCHRLSDAGTTGEVGPDLDKVLPSKSADFIRESIVNPNAEIAPGFRPGVMPQDFKDKLSTQQLDSLVEYLLKTAGKA